MNRLVMCFAFIAACDTAASVAEFVMLEAEPNNRAETANYVDTPATIVGTLEAGDRDCFRTALSVAVVDGALTMTREGNATCVEGVGDYRLAVSK